MTEQEVSKIIADYEALGFVMFPVGQDKIPPSSMKRWQDFLKAPMTHEMLVYYVVNREMNLAAITSDQTFYVVDDDYPKHDSKRPFGTELDSTIVAKTQNGGFHYYFKPFGMKNKQNIKITKQDFFHIDLRGNSPGYVLIPPFGGYEWVKPPTKQSLENMPATPPQAIMNIWNSKRELSPDDITGADFFEIQNLTEFRDPLLFERSFVLWQNHFKNPTHYTPSYILSILNDFNRNFGDPKPEHVVTKVFEQGRKYATSWANDQGIIKSQEVAPQVQPSKMTDDDLQNFKEYPMLKLGIENLDRAGIPTGMNLIIGQSGAGKSWFLNHIVKEAFNLNHQKSVIFSLEMDSNGLMKRMIQSYAKLNIKQMEDKLQRQVGVEMLRKVDPIIIDYTQVDRDVVSPLAITQAIHDHYSRGRKVFLFDHFMEIPGMSTNEKNQSLTEIWGDAFKAIRNAYDDIWLFILVQSNKEGYSKEFITKQYVRGSSALVDKCDYFLSINRPEKPSKDIMFDMDRPKKIVLWIDKNRRSIAERFAVSCVLDSTGNFIGESEQIFSESVEETEDRNWIK